MSHSKAFEEFVMKRSEEILSQDRLSQDMNKQIISAEEQFKASLDSKQISEYLKIENMAENQKEHENTLLYKAGFSDRLKAW